MGVSEQWHNYHFGVEYSVEYYLKLLFHYLEDFEGLNELSGCAMNGTEV